MVDNFRINLLMNNKKIAFVCASNQNRSMDAHHFFTKNGVQNIYSYGTNQQVKLPGASRDEPNVYDFKETYKNVFSDLLTKNKELYEHTS